MDTLMNFAPWQQALFATLFTWAVTALGSALVFAFKTIRSHALALMYGFAAGVMIAASFWSLLDPAINLAEQQDRIPWLVVGIGFAAGGFFLYLADKIIPGIYLKRARTEGSSRAAVKRAILLVFSITLHNIPEGLAVGVAFGAIGAAGNGEQAAMLLAATTVAIGIGLQNFPEGAAVSIPLRQGGMYESVASLHVWSGQWGGRTNRRSIGRSASGFGQLAAAIRPVICGWCDDLRRLQGAHPGSPRQD